VHESFNSVVAQVAGSLAPPDGLPRVERVVCAVDCGTAITPDVVRAQMEGGIGFGLAAALWSEVTLVQGRVQEQNFDDYRPLRIMEMPAVEVHIVPSGAAPTGVGEPGVPPIAPAVANAVLPAHRAAGATAAVRTAPARGPRGPYDPALSQCRRSRRHHRGLHNARGRTRARFALPIRSPASPIPRRAPRLSSSRRARFSDIRAA
jgi:hypothetical protein